MNTQKSLPPKLAVKLLNWFLPEDVKSEIIGDMTEEFNDSKDSLQKRKSRFWQQSITTLGQYFMTTKSLLKSAVFSLSIVVFLALSVAVTFLSHGEDDGKIYSNSYWTNGHIHLFFTESNFWDFISKTPKLMEPHLFINTPSIVWTFACICLLLLVRNRDWFTHKIFCITALVMLFTPYLCGVIAFKVNDIPLNQSGPVIAIMLLSIWYLILPLSYFFAKSLNKDTSVSVR